MNDRYNFDNNIKYNENRGRVYTSVYYPQILQSPDDIYIIAKETDRLDLLANKFYGDVTLWWVIAHANAIIGTLHVIPGAQIRIPADISSIIQDLNTINNS